MENVAYMDNNGVLNEDVSFYFFKLPQFLFSHPTLKKLSCESKLLYAVMLNRRSLSGTKDNKVRFTHEGHIYIRFSIDVVKEVLNCSKTTAVKALKELKENGLVLGKRDANNRSVKYFFLDIAEMGDMTAVFHEKLPKEDLDKIAEYEKLEEQKKLAEQEKVENVKTEESKAEDFSCPDGSKNQTGTGSESKPVQVQKVVTIKTDTKNNDSHKDLPLLSPSVSEEEDWWRRTSEREIREMLSDSWLGYEEENIEMFDAEDFSYLKNLVEGIAHTLFFKRTVKIDDRTVTSHYAFDQLFMLNHEDVEYGIRVLRSLKKNPHDLFKYAITVLFNAPYKSKAYWDKEVQKMFDDEPDTYGYAA